MALLTQHRFDIRFFLAGATTNFQVLTGDAKSVVRRAMTAWREQLARR
ncbi:hypothetical protein [Paraburkholderia phenoliruptrix]|nr:hypothetical protein [Paraburkholderia phenoliruptrix]